MKGKARSPEAREAICAGQSNKKAVTIMLRIPEEHFLHIPNEMLRHYSQQSQLKKKSITFWNISIGRCRSRSRARARV